MAFGEILRNARMQRGLTPSDVAENTHLLVQIVEDLEREDFRRVAAPIYGRGFVKLYAELLELDPEPLIREFMDLYAGARAPVVRTKKAEVPDEPAPEAVPVTRTVSGTVNALPQRQTVLARPAVAVRPLAAPQAAPEEGAGKSAAAPKENPGASAEPVRADAPLPEQVRCGFVVEPEEAEVEDEEPDLFNPKPLPRRHAVSGGIGPEAGEKQKPAAARRVVKSPIFKIGGRLEAAAEAPAVHDAEAHERRRARIKAFVDGVAALKQGVESKLPDVLPQKRLMLLGGAGLAVLICMVIGIRVLFKLTGENVKETPNPVFEAVTPPPDLYVD
ncbi:MAG: helix-turn-helix domain-containing protein [Kiritimatiellae bacterium]|nr:helix-turn-helix domain-containing protein [Kiritimatiellia bacterium]